MEEYYPQRPIIEGLRSHTDTQELAMRESDEKANYEEQIQRLKDEHEKEVNQMREDYGFVIATLKLGSSSEAMIDLQSKINEQEHEMEEMKREFGVEKVNLVNKLKRAESASMFSLRRNEEMSNKIYVMQLELEEMDDKHQAEIEYYQEKLSSIDTEKDKCEDSEKQAENVNKKKRKLMKRSLEELRGEHERKMESFALRIKDDKETELQEMAEKISKLEILIDDMKLGHVRAIKDLEESHREEKVVSITKERERVHELESDCETLKATHEEQVEDLIKEHKEEMDRIRRYYEQEIGDLKRRKVSKSQAIRRKTSVDTASLILKALAEQNEKDAKEELLKRGHSFSPSAGNLPDIAKNLPVSSYDDMDLEKSMESIRKQYSEEFSRVNDIEKTTNNTNKANNANTTNNTNKTNTTNTSNTENIGKTTDKKLDSENLKQLTKDKELLSKKLLDVQEAHKNEIKTMNDKYTLMKSKLESVINSMKTNADNTSKSIHVRNEMNNNDGLITRNIKESINLFDKRTAVQHKVRNLVLANMESRKENRTEEKEGKPSEVECKENLKQNDKKEILKIPRSPTNRQSVEITVKMGQNQDSIISRKTSMVTPASPKIVDNNNNLRRNSVAVNQRAEPGGLNPGTCLPKATTRLSRRTSGTVQRRKTLYENIYIGIPTAESKT